MDLLALLARTCVLPPSSTVSYLNPSFDMYGHQQMTRDKLLHDRRLSSGIVEFWTTIPLLEKEIVIPLSLYWNTPSIIFKPVSSGLRGSGVEAMTRSGIQPRRAEVQWRWTSQSQDTLRVKSKHQARILRIVNQRIRVDGWVCRFFEIRRHVHGVWWIIHFSVIGPRYVATWSYPDYRPLPRCCIACKILAID